MWRGNILKAGNSTIIRNVDVVLLHFAGCLRGQFFRVPLKYCVHNYYIYRYISLKEKRKSNDRFMTTDGLSLTKHVQLKHFLKISQKDKQL